MSKYLTCASSRCPRLRCPCEVRRCRLRRWLRALLPPFCNLFLGLLLSDFTIYISLSSSGSQPGHTVRLAIWFLLATFFASFSRSLYLFITFLLSAGTLHRPHWFSSSPSLFLSIMLALYGFIHLSYPISPFPITRYDWLFSLFESLYTPSSLGPTERIPDVVWQQDDG